MNKNCTQRGRAVSWKTLLLTMIIFAVFAAQARAGVVDDILRKAGTWIGRKAVREAGEEAIEQGGRKVLRAAGKETAEALAKRAGVQAAKWSDDVAKVAATHGSSVAPLINAFGDDAAKAIGKTSERNARRLVMLGDELAASGQGGEVLRLVGSHSQADEIVDALWRHKGKLAATGVVAALLLNTDEVLTAGTKVADSALKNVGSPIAQQMGSAAGRVIETLLWMLIATFAVSAGLAIWMTCTQAGRTTTKVLWHSRSAFLRGL